LRGEDNSVIGMRGEYNRMRKDMKYDAKIHHRRSIRLKDFPYNKPGHYFVTFATRNLECVFGDVVGGEIKLNRCGEIAMGELKNL